MSAPPKGSIIIADGQGKVTYAAPTQDSMVLSTDSTDSKGVTYINASSLLIGTASQANATSTSFISTTSYTTLMYISVPGENTKRIKNIYVCSYVYANTTSYQVKLYNQTSNTTIAEVTLSNHIISINDMGTLVNLPAGLAILEVQAKRTGGNTNSRVFVPECTINYYN